MKRLILFPLCLWLIPVAAQPLGSDVAGLLNYAREHNPELAALQYEIDAAQQRAAASDALPDPVLRTELMDFTNRGTGRGASLLPSQVGATRYLLMQSLPWFGRLGLQREIAQAQVNKADGQKALTWAELSGKIKSTYAQHYYFSGSEKLTQEMLVLMTYLEKVAQSRYANGLGAQQDVIRTQVEQTNLRSELIELENMSHHMHGRLNALLSRPNQAELAMPAQVRLLPSAAKLDLVTLLEKLRTRNPQLQMADAGINEAEKRRDLSYNNRYPGFTLGIAPTQSGNQLKSWDLMLEFSIPLQQGVRRSQEREAESMLAASSARKEAVLNQLQSDFSEIVAGLDTVRRTETLLLTRLLPQAELTYQSALAGYENGKVDFATMLEAQRQILKARQQLLKSQLEAQLRLSEIESLTGEEL
jgi:outer membrane protein TolC